MTYKEMYQEYERSIENQDILIKRHEQLLNKAWKEKSAKDIEHQNKILLTLYAEKSELIERATGLKEYIEE